MRVKIVDTNYQYDKMFTERGWELVDSVGEADLVQFTGGADVSPKLYGEENVRSYTDPDRDMLDLSYFREALALKTPMAGICRGGQFLNVMSGGKMVQDVVGHANGKLHLAHNLVYNADFDGGVHVTSTHHQMMVPGMQGIVLLTSEIVGDADTEAVWYQHTKALCFQPHPEFDEAKGKCRDLYFWYLWWCFGFDM